MSIKITIQDKITFHWVFISNIKSINHIDRGLYIFQNFQTNAQVLQKQKEICIFSAAFYIQLNVDTYFIVILNCF